MGGAQGAVGGRLVEGGERGGREELSASAPKAFFSSFFPPVSGARGGDKARNTRREASTWTVGSATGCRGWWVHAPGFCVLRAAY